MWALRGPRRARADQILVRRARADQILVRTVRAVCPPWVLCGLSWGPRRARAGPNLVPLAGPPGHGRARSGRGAEGGGEEGSPGPSGAALSHPGFFFSFRPWSHQAGVTYRAEERGEAPLREGRTISGAPGAIPRPCWAALETSWAVLGTSWVVLEPPWTSGPIHRISEFLQIP